MTWKRGIHVAAATLVALGALFAFSSALEHHSPRHRATTIRANGLDLRMVEAGSGQPIVLLHGYGESLVAWQGVFDRLAPYGRVIAIDLPGFGLSTKPATGYQTDSIAAVMVAALRSLGVSDVVLAGHSLGGAVAAAMTLAAPGLVRSLVLVDAALVAPPRALPESSRAAPAKLFRSAITRYEIMRTRFSSLHAPSWLAESDSALSYVPARDAAYSVALEAVLREFDFAWLTAERAAAIRIPVLVIWGQLDPVIPPGDGRRLADALPQAEFRLIALSWHRPHVERPAETADAIRGFALSSP